MAFPFLAAIPVVGKIIEKIVGVVDQHVEDKDAAAKLKADITLSAMSMDHSEIQTLVKEQASIVRAEATGHSWLQRNWRPMLMMIIILIIFNNYVLFPYLSLFTTKAVMLVLPEQLWGLIKIGVGGYVVGRSGEKFAKVWKENK
jgi:predicted MFS family arabinose efflux permease